MAEKYVNNKKSIQILWLKRNALIKTYHTFTLFLKKIEERAAEYSKTACKLC